MNRAYAAVDLGVLFDPEVNFIEHINQKVSEAYRMYGFIVRNCRQFNNVSALKCLFFSYVRSKLEYCSIIWNPYYRCHVERLESVQRRFLKYLSFKLHHVYPERGIDYQLLLNLCGIDSL